MKKRWKLSLGLAIILTYIGCGNDATNPSAPPLDVTVQPSGGKNQALSGTTSPSAVPTDIQPSVEDTPQGYHPEETLAQAGRVIIPWGDSISLDLDGDGEKEAVSMRLSIDSARSNGEWQTALPVLSVDDAVFGEEDFYKLCYTDSESFSFFRIGWCILDIDTSDPYCEIAVQYSGNQNDRTCFLRYGKGEFAYIGSTETRILMDLPSGMPWQGNWPDAPIEPDWEAARTIILNGETERFAGLPGNGDFWYFNAYHEVLQTTEYGKMTWHLKNAGDLQAKLVLDPEYLDYGEPASASHVFELERDMVFSRCKGSEDGETVMLPAGTQIWFRHYYPEGRWMEISYDEDGIYGEGSQTAWFQVVKEVNEDMDYPHGLIRLPEGEVSPEGCFGGGFVWGG